MTQDYRKRAEEFINNVGYKLNRFTIPELEKAFQQVAQEARSEENEACATLLETGSYYERTSSEPRHNREDAAQAIRSRMEKT